MSDTQKPSYWAVLPAIVRYDPDIPSTAKLLYAEISALTDGSGYCFAGNEYLASNFGVSIKSVQRLIKNLADKGYIQVDVIRDPNSNAFVSRRIFAGVNPAGETDPPHLKNKVTSPQKCGDPSPQKCGEEQYNYYLSNNNGQNRGQEPDEPKKTASIPKHKPERFLKLWDWYPHSHRGHRKAAVKAWDKLKLSDEDIDKIALALRKQMKTELWSQGIGIPYVSTYLNGAYWEEADDIAETEPKASGWADDPEVL